MQAIIAQKPIVLVGLMGCGKSAIGKLLAQRLDCPFFDSDFEIEKVSSLTIKEIFDQKGEAQFRKAEANVISRLLEGPPCVLATGGGAFMNDNTRDLIKEHALSIWMKADLDILMERVMRKSTRPLLQNANPRAVMADLIEKRYPIYAQADIDVLSENISKSEMVEKIIDAVLAYRHD